MFSACSRDIRAAAVAGRSRDRDGDGAGRHPARTTASVRRFREGDDDDTVGEREGAAPRLGAPSKPGCAAIGSDANANAPAPAPALALVLAADLALSVVMRRSAASAARNASSSALMATPPAGASLDRRSIPRGRSRRAGAFAPAPGPPSWPPRRDARQSVGRGSAARPTPPPPPGLEKRRRRPAEVCASANAAVPGPTPRFRKPRSEAEEEEETPAAAAAPTLSALRRTASSCSSRGEAKVTERRRA